MKKILHNDLKLRGNFASVRSESEAIDSKLREAEEERKNIDESLESNRIQLEKARLEYQTLEVRRATIEEQLVADKMELNSLVMELPEGSSEKEYEEKLLLLGDRIQKLGSPNLAAIDDFKVQSERKNILMLRMTT